MYEPLLLVHSWVRWGVFFGVIYFLGVSIYAIITRRTWAASDSRFIWAFNQAFLYQALFGFTIWLAASPIVKAALSQPRTILATPLFNFWVLVHPLMMIAAVGVFQAGKAWTTRAPLSARFKIYAVTFTIVLAMITYAIPWPFLNYGRPWFRIP